MALYAALGCTLLQDFAGFLEFLGIGQEQEQIFRVIPVSPSCSL